MENVLPVPPSVASGKTRSCAKHKFTHEEDQLLAQSVAEHGPRDWKLIASKVGTRNCRQCRERWKNYLDPCLSQEPWSRAEDELLSARYHQLGSHWSAIAKCFPTRTDVNCRNRWTFLATRWKEEELLKKYQEGIAQMCDLYHSPTTGCKKVSDLQRRFESSCNATVVH
jgi:myb proto-oncogene protein